MTEDLLSAEKKKQPGFTYRGVKFQAVPVSPSGTKTPLQISCFFDYGKNREMKGGTQAVDEHFGGAIKKLREEGYFPGEALETLLIVPGKGEIPAQHLLLVGLGDPAAISARLFENVGRIAVVEALKMQVPGFCFAPSVRDAGIVSLSPDAVSGALIKGMAQAIRTSQILHVRGLAPPSKLQEAIFLAGPEHLEGAYKGIKHALEQEDGQ